MKKLSKIILALSVLLVLNCGKSEFGQIGKIMNESNKTTERFIKDIDKAENAKEVAKILSSFSESMVSIKNKLELYKREDPEMAAIVDRMGEPPEELKKTFAKSDELRGQLLDETIFVALNYIDDPDVAKALKLFENVF